MSLYLKFIPLLILDVVSALAARYSYNNGDFLFLVIAMASLAVAGYLFMKLLSENVTIVINAIWVALGAINVTLASYLVFGETISLLQGAGIALIVFGLVVIDYFNQPKEA